MQIRHSSKRKEKRKGKEREEDLIRLSVVVSGRVKMEWSWGEWEGA